MNSWFVYMIRCSNGSLYTGCTSNLIRRWHEHREGKGAKYLRIHEPRKVVFVEEHPDRSEACRREYRIKQLPKEKKEELIEHR
ncbi:MAG: GIY-YIG nuclease family protein [Balneolaceae bacterium]|nr:GIY-YIG nuclease family protein [Balneolaceae bacterium]